MARQGNAQETARRDGAGRQRHGKAAVIRLDGLRHTGFCAEPLRRKPAVFVITPQMQAQLRVVVPASYTASSAIIASGLMPGDRVITAGVSKLRPGEKVVAGERLP
jgi:multidrug efflux pump subunit AcrA (membrane-fusion protein)